MFLRHAVIVVAVCAAVPVSPLLAQDLVYRPVNPSFGGNALNSAHLQALANAQRTATASDADDGSGSGGGGGDGDGGTGGETDVDLFIRQLQGRLLSALASEVTEAIFGENPQDSGTIRFGDTIVEFERTADAITLRIIDGDGTVTVITVPQLVVSDDSNSALAARLTDSGLGATLDGSLAGSGSLTSGSLSAPLN
jgi:curli production assembly/transport component CsgF